MDRVCPCDVDCGKDNDYLGSALDAQMVGQSPDRSHALEPAIVGDASGDIANRS